MIYIDYTIAASATIVATTSRDSSISNTRNSKFPIASSVIFAT